MSVGNIIHTKLLCDRGYNKVAFLLLMTAHVQHGSKIFLEQGIKFERR